MKLKKLFSLLLSVLLIAAFSGCQSQHSPSEPSSSLSSSQLEEPFPFEGVPLSEIDFSKAITQTLPAKPLKEMQKNQDEEWYIWRILYPYILMGPITDYPEDLVSAELNPRGYSQIDFWVASMLYGFFKEGFNGKTLEEYGTLPPVYGLLDHPLQIPAEDLVKCSEKYFGNIPDAHALLKKAKFYNPETDCIEETGPLIEYMAGIEYAVNAVEVLDQDTLEITFSRLSIYPETSHQEAYSLLDAAMKYRNYIKFRLTVKVNGSEFQYQDCCMESKRSVTNQK